MDEKQSRFKRIFRISLFILAAIALAMLFLDDIRRGTTEPPAAQLLPDLPAYRQVEGQTITTYIGALSEGAALLAGQPQLALTIGALDKAVDCYQEVGGVRARVYSHTERPLEAGVVAVVDEAVINDPDTLFRCITPAALDLQGPGDVVLEPCTAAFTLQREEGTFHVIYAGSTFATCRDFCASIEGCVVHLSSQNGGPFIARSPVTAIINEFAGGLIPTRRSEAL